MIIATSRKPSLQRSPTMRVGSYARTQACSTNYRLNLFRGGKIVPHVDLLEVSPWQAKGKSQWPHRSRQAACNAPHRHPQSRPAAAATIVADACLTGGVRTST